MKLADLMTREVRTVSPSTTVKEATETMKCFDVGILPVCNEGELLGVLTARDIVVRVVADGHDPCAITVREAMTPYVVCCHVEDDAAKAVKIMKNRNIRRLIVVGRGNVLAGVVTMWDLASRAGGEKTVAKEPFRFSQVFPCISEHGFIR